MPARNWHGMEGTHLIYLHGDGKKTTLGFCAFAAFAPQSTQVSCERNTLSVLRSASELKYTLGSPKPPTTSTVYNTVIRNFGLSYR